MKTESLTACIALSMIGMGCAGSAPGPEDPTPEIAPVLYIVSMMHAEESTAFHQNAAVYERHASALEEQRALFANHGARLDFGPDWTFIEGVKRWDPTQLTDHLAAGQGLHTHAHETQWDLANVNERLASVGVEGNPIANGGFLEEGPDGSNWMGYVSSLQDSAGTPLFSTAIGFKNPQTQIPDSSGTCFRPSVDGDWDVHDPNGRMLYLGSNSPGIAGEGALDFETLRSWMDDRLANLDPDAINTLYWHDSLHKYGQEQDAATRRARWEQEFDEYLDPLADAGLIQWATFQEMAAVCAE